MAAALEGEGPLEGEIDERFEYDAPRFYDFDEGSPPGAPADGWFDTEGPKGLATPPRPTAAEPPPEQAAAAAGAGHTGQQAEAGAKGGKGKGAEWRRALASISNTKAQQQAQQQAQQPHAAAVKPAAKQGTKRRAAAEPAAGSSGGDAAAAAGAGSRPTSAAAGAAKQGHQATGGQADGASSPRLHSSLRSHHAAHKTSEQLELERVEREKAEAAALRRKNAAAVKAVLAPPPPPVAHSSKPLTEPVGLELCTSKRHRLHGMETRSMASPFKSAAEQIAAFEGRVPAKTRLGDKGKAAAAAAAEQQQQQQQQQARGHHAALTVPHSPRFATKKRVRPPRFKPREEVEAEEMAAMPKFKARPVNKRILQDRSGQLGVPHVETKAPTVPEPFALKTDQRAVEHSGGAHSSAAASGSAGAGGIFVFGAQGNEGSRVTRSRAAKKAAAGGSSWTGQLTQPEPFRLATDMRGAIKRTAVAEPQQEQHEARPAKRARQGPFHLATDEPGAAEQTRLEGIRRQQEELARQEAEFKALPLNKAALAGAWKPAAQVVAALTVPQDVALHSDARAAQRRQFDDAMAAKQAAAEAERAEAERQRAEQEEEERREHRKRLGHKALPLPDRL